MTPGCLHHHTRKPRVLPEKPAKSQRSHIVPIISASSKACWPCPELHGLECDETQTLIWISHKKIKSLLPSIPESEVYRGFGMFQRRIASCGAQPPGLQKVQWDMCSPPTLTSLSPPFSPLFPLSSSGARLCGRAFYPKPLSKHFPHKDSSFVSQEEY